MEVVQCNQPATRQLADRPTEWCHTGDSVLASAAGRLDVQVEARSALASGRPCHWGHASRSPCHHGHFVHEPAGLRQGCLGEQVDWYPQNRSSLTLMLKSSSAEVTLSHSLGTQISSLLAPTQRGLSTHLFPRFPCHQLSNHVPSKSLTFRPNHWPVSVSWYIIAHLTISPPKQSRYAGTLPDFWPRKDFPSSLSFQAAQEMGCSSAALHFQEVLAYFAEPSAGQAPIFSSSVNRS